MGLGGIIGGAIGSLIPGVGPVGGAILGSALGGGSKSGTQTTTTNSQPWAELQPFLKDIYNLSQKQYKGFTPTYYPEQGFAPFDPLQIAAQKMAMQYATGSSQLPGFNLPAMPSASPTYVPKGTSPLYPQPTDRGAPITEPPPQQAPQQAVRMPSVQDIAGSLPISEILKKIYSLPQQTNVVQPNTAPGPVPTPTLPFLSAIRGLPFF